MAKLKVEIDKNKCIGCGVCVSLHPDLFEMGPDGKARFIGGDKEGNEKGVREAIASCPMGAIKIKPQ